MIESVLQKVIIKFGGDNSELNAAANAAVDKLKMTGMAMESFGRKASLAITAPLAIAQTMSISAFAEFDDAITKSTAIMTGMTTEMRSQMMEQAKVMSMDSVTSAKDLAEGYYFLASAGKTAEQSIKSLSIVNSFAVAGDFQMAKATEMLSDAQNALGLATSDTTQDMINMTRVSDVLVQANIMASASTQQFGEAITNKAGARLRMLNKDMEEGVAVLMAYAAAGTKGSMAGEKLDIMLRELAHAQANNSQEWSKLGVALYDNDGAMLKTWDIIGQLEEKFGGLSDQSKYAAFDMLGLRSESMSAIAPLLGQSEAIRKYSEDLKNASGVTADIEKNQKSFKSEMLILKNTITVLALEAGEVLVPRVRLMNSVIQEAIVFWRGLGPGLREASVYLVSAAASIGPVTIALGMLVQNGKTLIPVLQAVGTAASSTFTMLRVGAVAALAPIAPYIAVIGAIGAAVAGVSYLVYGPDGFTHAWDMANSAIQSFWDLSVGFFENFEQNMNALLSWMGENWVNILNDIGQAILVFASNAVSNFATITYTYVRLVSAFLGWLSNVVPATWNYLFSDEFVNAVSEGVTKAAQFIAASFTAIGQYITTTMGSIGEAIVGIASEMVSAISDIAGMAKDAFMGILSGELPDVNKFLSGIAERVSEGAGKITEKMTVAMQSGMEAVGESLEATKQQIIGDFNKGAEDINFFNTAGDIINEQMSKIKNPLDGFVASTVTSPELILSRKKMDEQITSTTTTAGIDKPKFEADTKWLEAEKKKLEAPVVFTVSGKLEAVQKGSAEAIARIQEYQNSVTMTQGLDGSDIATSGGDKKKMTSKQIEDQKMMNDLLQQIAKNTQKDRDSVTIKSAELTSGGI
jgi:TP901 family phage tail tape measure protein